MATPSTAGRPTPERIFNALNAFQQTAALRTAIELDVFTAIGAGANIAAALAAKTGASEKGVRILCDYLTIQGFLTKEQERYALTQESAIFLDRKSPACLASMAGFLGTERARSIFDSLTLAVRNGGSVWSEGDNTKPNDEFWVAFARSMAPLTVRHVWDHRGAEKSEGGSCRSGLAGGVASRAGKRAEIWSRGSLQRARRKRV